MSEKISLDSSVSISSIFLFFIKCTGSSFYTQVNTADFYTSIGK